MSHRNYDPRKCVPEENDMSYMNVPRTSLRIRDVIDRAIRGAPIDCPDTSDFFDGTEDDDTPAHHRWADMSDHVDAHEYAMEQEERMKSKLRGAQDELQQKLKKASKSESSAETSTEQAETAPSDKRAKRSKSSAGSEPAEVD